MKILVTGRPGRVGANLAKTLLERGHQVRALIYPHDVARMHKLDPFGVETIVGDLGNQSDLATAVSGVDVIFHLAAAMIGPFDNAAYFATNAQGTFNIVEAARQHAPNLQRFVYASTDAVYPVFPDTEPDRLATEDMVVQPTQIYALTKWLGERTCLAYQRQYNLPVVACRFAWVLGPGEIIDPSYVRSIWLRQAIDTYRGRVDESPEMEQAYQALARAWTGREALVINRSLTGMADSQHWVDLRDLLQGLLLAMVAPDAIGEVINLPGPSMTSFDQLVPRLSERLAAPYVEVALPVHLSYRRLSWEKANHLLDYTPRHDMESTLALAMATRRGESIDLLPTGTPYAAKE